MYEISLIQDMSHWPILIFSLVLLIIFFIFIAKIVQLFRVLRGKESYNKKDLVDNIGLTILILLVIIIVTMMLITTVKSVQSVNQYQENHPEVQTTTYDNKRIDIMTQDIVKSWAIENIENMHDYKIEIEEYNYALTTPIEYLANDTKFTVKNDKEIICEGIISNITIHERENIEYTDVLKFNANINCTKP